jgi:hypothetical protein
MPQFDTFSFFSQLFWVFFGFLVLYVLLCFYLLPALATILKIRRRKLTQVNADSTSTNLLTTSNTMVNYTNTFISDFNAKIGSIETTSLQNTILNSNLNSFSVTFETSRELNLTFVNQTQMLNLIHVMFQK